MLHFFSKGLYTKRQEIRANLIYINLAPEFVSGRSNLDQFMDYMLENEIPCYKKFIGCKFFQKALLTALENDHDEVFLYIFAHLLDLNEKNEEQLKEVYKFVKFVKKPTARDLYKDIIDSYDIEINHGILDDWEKFLLERSLYEKDDLLLRNLVVLRNSDSLYDSENSFSEDSPLLPDTALGSNRSGLIIWSDT